ncbi:MAG TPA: MoaD/ThiS family protein [Spirochaetota bacterium]|nr:MoaD/ThiS family protein [Spirochaetota bacterium]
MTITVHLSGVGPLRDVVGERPIELPAGATIAVLASLLDIRKDYNEVYIVNGRRRARDAPLEQGDIVKVVSLMAGG